MQNRLIMGTAALLLASALTAGAQTGTPSPAAPTSPSSGSIDVGGRFTTTEGDEARYERYRDLRDGADVDVLYNRESDTWAFTLKALNVGYRDQSYLATFNSGRVKGWLSFDQTPLNYYYDAKTAYVCTAGDCALDPALRTRVQGGTATGIPMNVGQLTNGSIYSAAGQQFDLQSRRDTIAGGVRISATDHLDFTLEYNTYSRSGNLPWGAAFAFNVDPEMPLEIDNRETDVITGLEWASHQGMFKVAYQYSKFDQEIPTFRWDNPQRATDFCRPGLSGQAPGTCYDPSGYSNGNGPAAGLMAMPPSSNVNTFMSQGMIKLPGRTTANGSLSMSAHRQDAELIPWSTNPVVMNPATFAAFPELAHLPRETANVRVNYMTATANLSSRAIQDVILTGRYRYHGRSDTTRPFEAHEYVRMDAVPEETGGAAEPYTFSRNTIDANAAYVGIPRTTIRVGYGLEQMERGIRTTDGYEDDILRASLDFVGNEYVSLRALYEKTDREAVNLHPEALAHAAMQPAARFFDEASMKRDRTTLVVDVTPTASLGFSASFAKGKDDYDEADPTQEFGLLETDSTAYTVGVNYAPSLKVNVGADYGREELGSLLESRNANPAPDPSWTDPNRNWTMDNEETINTLTAYVNLVKPFAKVDVSANYNYSDSDQAFTHGGPRITAPGFVFVPLPGVTNSWHQAQIDVRYTVSEKLGFGLGYWYEKFDVEDYATINTAGPQTLPRTGLGAQTEDPRYDWLGSIFTGYAARPYKGQTVFVRMFYNF